MKAIAWDDERRDDGVDYMSRLCSELRRYGVQISVELEMAEFQRRITAEPFDFYICDWLNKGGRATAPREEEEPGGDLLVNAIRLVNATAPIFIVSSEMGRIDGNLIRGFRPISIKSKDVNVRWMAFDIVENLRELGVMVDCKKVFIIYGHDRRADGSSRRVEDWLRARGINSVRFNAQRSSQGILPDLMREMNTCSAFIAVCTPDDYCGEGLQQTIRWWQPRQNVLFEMGIVFGLHRGAKRLTILQKWVDGVTEECACLPSDWGGYVTIRFADDIRQQFDALEARLRSLGVAMQIQEPV